MSETGSLIVEWYSKNKRDLPWRQTRDPYRIWLSEIILQQTRVAQGLPYYQKFVNAFSNVAELAAADEEYVLNLWAGLGYYSRARNLLAAARQVVEEFDGKFPTNYQDLVKLKGVGDYTAAAIASFSSGEAVPVVDGNVFRVVARLFNMNLDIASAGSRPFFKEKAHELMDGQDPAQFNQAIMEFGAMQCSPSPNCMYCPVIEHCQGYAEGRVKELPVKIRKTKVKEVFFHFFFAMDGENIALQKRNDRGIWRNMYQLPLREVGANEFKAAALPLLWETGHQLSHRSIKARFFAAERPDLAKFSDILWVDRQKMDRLPFPRLIEKFFKEVGF